MLFGWPGKVPLVTMTRKGQKETLCGVRGSCQTTLPAGTCTVWERQSPRRVGPEALGTRGCERRLRRCAGGALASGDGCALVRLLRLRQEPVHRGQSVPAGVEIANV